MEKILIEKVPGKFQKALRFVFEQKEIPIREMLKNGHPEFGFIYKWGGYRIEGKIDLWGTADQELWILDYKTGSVDHKEKAFQQLKIYSVALMKMFKIERARLAVIYPMDEKIFVEMVEQGEEFERQALGRYY